MKKPLRILITNHGLENYAGSETYVMDIAKSLLRRGHNPVVFAPHLGAPAQDLDRAGIPVVNDLNALREAPDIIHAQHHPEAIQALLHWPDVPSVAVCHGWLPWIDRPLVYPSIRRYVAVDDQCRERFMTTPGIDPHQVRTLYNFVDLGRFKPRAPLPEKPARALIFNNLASTDTTVLTIQAACARRDIHTVEVMGMAMGTPHPQPELFLGNFDIVFAKGRCALEAMAVGCAVVITDYSGMGGMVTAANADTMRRYNFGYRPTMAGPATEERLYEALGNYNSHDAAAVSAYVRMHAEMEANIDLLEALYNEALAEPFEKPSPQAALHAAADYLRFLTPVLKQHIQTQDRANAAENKALRAERETQEARIRLDAAEKRCGDLEDKIVDMAAALRESGSLCGVARMVYEKIKKRVMVTGKLRKRFSTIYGKDEWTVDGVKSGPGSTMSETEHVRAALPALLAELKTRTLLDLGCGDYGWMRTLALPVNYIGADIVPELIARHQAQEAGANRAFMCLDAATDILPPCDTVLCRHVLFHLSDNDVFRVFSNLHKSSAVYLLATNHDDIMKNMDIRSGGFRRMNLCAAPFFLPQPVLRIPDPAPGAGSGRSLCLWRVVDLPRHPRIS